MKLELDRPLASSDSPNNHSEHSKLGCNFKYKLPTFLKEIDLRTHSLTESSKTPKSFQQQVKFSAQKNKLSSDICSLLQTSNKMFYFLGRSTADNHYSEILVYEYMKADGKLQHMELNGIKGVIMSMKAKFCPRRIAEDKKMQGGLKRPRKSQSTKNTIQNVYQIVLLLGTQNGHLKTIRFNDIQPSSTQTQPSIQSRKIDFTSLIDIAILNPEHFSNANVCLILSMTNRVYLVNFDYMMVLAVFVPPIVNCEVGLSIDVHMDGQYFVQACEGGYVVFWDLGDKVKRVIKDSCSRAVTIAGSQLLTNKQQLIKQQPQQQPIADFKPPLFKPDQIHYCITPISIFHSATITGLKFCQLYADLLLIITQGGLIKLLAINNSPRSHMNENEFCLLFQYQVDDGELISDTKFFPDTREIFIVKNALLEGMVEKSGRERFVQVREYSLETKSKKRNNTTLPYRPFFLKDIKRSFNASQSQRSRSVGNNAAKCYFERIIFNTELEIERTDKIYPNHVMECIDSVDLVENKDLLFLRGKDFYLVGQTDLFKTIDLE